MKIKRNILFTLVLIFFISGCSENRTVKIALSKGKGSPAYEKYSQWLKSINQNIECIDLYHLDFDSAMKVLEDCDGLLLTGGPDVHPGRYDKQSDTSRCEIDEARDTLEFTLIKKAFKKKMPILGICRGQQILNIALGGSLIVDIPEDVGTNVVHRCDNPDSCFHKISIVKNSLLHHLVNIDEGVVNTNHHQAIDRIANDLISTSSSEDGIIESVEWKDKINKPFLLAVQWHPERLDYKNPLSLAIGEAFLDNVLKNKYQKIAKK